MLNAARQHRDWMLRSGTTTIEAKSGYGLERETEFRMLRVLAQSECLVIRPPFAPEAKKGDPVRIVRL